MASVLPEKVDVAFEEQRFGVLRPRSKTRHKRSMDGDESGAKHAPVQAQGSRRPRSISMGTRNDRTHELMYVPPFVQRAETGERVRLTSLWENCKAVVGFLRHFGCRSCWRDAAYLNSLKPTLDKHGVKLIAIAIGSTAQACAFKQDTKFEGDLYVDDIPSIAPNAEFPKFDPEKLPVAAEELKSTPGIQRSTDGYAGHETQMTKPTDASYAYASFRLKRSTNIVYRETVLEFVQPPDAAFKDLGHYGGTEARWPADFLQLGGLFVLGPGNHCDYAYRSYYVGDFPLDGEVLTAATGVKPEGQSFLFPSTQGWVDKLNMDTVVDPSPPTKSESAAPEPIATPVPPPPVIAKKSEAVDPPAVAVEPLPSAPSLFNALPVPFHLSMLLSGLVLIVSVWAKDHSVVRAFIAALSVFAVYLVTLLQSAPKSQQSPATSATPPAAEEKPVEDEPLTFFTPREIDEMVLAARASGKFEDCECSDVMGRIPMNLRLEPRPAPSANQAIKENPSDSDDSDLSDSSDDLSRRSLSNLSKLVDQLEKASSYEIRVYQTTLCYVREFLAKPHPLVGRPGPTCPFVPKSLRLNSINIRVIRTGVNPSVERMKQIALGCIPQFEALHPRTGRLSLYKAIILVFPDIPLEDAPRLIDGVQRALKPSFVAKGMMVGEFHLKNNCPGLRNSKFFPLRTPYPSLAMRNMVPSDLVFLTMDQYEPQTRVSFLESYIRTLSSPKDADEDAGMADATPGAIGASKELAIAKEELEKVRQQIANGA